MVRLQKFLADAGIASRRAAEKLITDGRVAVNDVPVTLLGTRINPDKDEVAVDGKPVRARKKLYLALHKPPGYLCTKSDPERRRIVADLLPPEKKHLQTIGRLDRASEGLILLTNDGSFSLRMAHPRYGVTKTYLATVQGKLNRNIAEKLTQGVHDRGEFLRARRAHVISANNTRSNIEIDLSEGKNREVRRLLAAHGFKVERLIRTQIGKIPLGNLPAGKWRTLTEPEIKSLLAP